MKTNSDFEKAHLFLVYCVADLLCGVDLRGNDVFYLPFVKRTCERFLSVYNELYENECQK